jgi:pSer/pThr/pTyr-binding forkhead associated (FHA) protein
MAVATRTDPPGASAWRVLDKVDRFRVWAGSPTYRLPTDDDRNGCWLIGSDSEDEAVWLSVPDESVRMSRRHAALTRDDVGWQLADLGSKNGTSLDGVPLRKFKPVAIEPGAEIRMARLTLVAESPMLRQLQENLRWFKGWDDRREIDDAVGSIRQATAGHRPLVLRAENSHVVIARSLHADIVGANRPFVVFGRRTSTKSAASKKRPARRAATFETGMEALAVASGGTLVVWRNRLPVDFEQVLAAVRDSERVMLIICVEGVAHGPQAHPQLVVPSLSERPGDLDRMIDVYAASAPAKIRGVLTTEERAWVKAQRRLSLLKLRTGTRRVLALRAANGKVTRAAALADVGHGTLSTWCARRPDPPALEIDDGYDSDDDDDDDDDDGKW